MTQSEILIAMNEAAQGDGNAFAISAEPKPLLLVLSLERHISPECIKNIRKTLQNVFEVHNDLPPLVILLPGMTLEAVLDPRHKEGTPIA